MTGGCTNKNCFVNEGESCAEGNPDKKCCQYWSLNEVEGNTESVDSSAIRVPWSGSAFGGADLINLTPRGRSILIGVLGAENSGKTTFLVGNYLQLLRGSKIGHTQFSGSLTLGAWESLSSWLRFDSANSTVSFPPHTARGTERVPGILHLSFRNENEEMRDILLTDAPGEWFTSWSVNETAIDAEGARWVVKHADAFIIFADSEKLSGKERGQARSDLRQLIERLGNHAGNRPAILAWAKNDQKPPEKMVASIRRALNENITNSKEVEISVTEPDSLTEAFSVVLGETWTPPLALSIIEPVHKQDPFSAFRGHHANA
ncbi:hypothetical protein L8S13_01990 [Vibrio lentus]|uniref:TRAFAC clade GTPase domain-containing protein n=1 Tax=Vibrio lentus TaxID=136468 RepID=UPI002469B7AE|nr:hypothetical protein [Vibrio lentus]MDH5925054.1 hypothetical protein [Vibrio lentus]